MRAIKSHLLGNPENPKTLILASFTIYAFFFARNDDVLGVFFLLGMALLSLLNPRLGKLTPQFFVGLETFALLFGCLVSLFSQCQRQMIEPGKQPEQ